ncbi:MAG TPA: DUF3954 domain-containing protein [Bacillales bacterium]
MTAEIDLMQANVKDGKLIEHQLPDYGETRVITLGRKVDRFGISTKRKV